MSALLGSVAEGLISALRPLEAAFGDAEELERFLRQFGWRADLSPADQAAIQSAFALSSLVQTAEAAIDQVVFAPDGKPDPTLLKNLLAATAAFVNALRSLEAAPPTGLPFPFDQATFWSQLPVEIAEHLLVSYLQRQQPLVFSVLSLFGVIEVTHRQPTAAGRVPYNRQGFRWDRLSQLVTDPIGLLKQVYQWNDPNAPFLFDQLLRAVERALLAMGAAVRRRFPPAALRDALYDPTNRALPTVRQLQIPVIAGPSPLGEGFLELGVAAMAATPLQPGGTGTPRPHDTTKDPDGILISAMLSGEVATEIPLGHSQWLGLRGDLQSESVGIELHPTAVAPFVSAGATTFDGRISLAGRPPRPYVLLGDPDSNRIEVAGTWFALEVRGALDNPEVVVQIGTSDPAGVSASGTTASPGVSVVIDFSDADGFLQKVASSQSERIDLSCAIEWSSRTGFHFSGQARLSATIPVHLTIANVLEIDSVYLAVRAGTAGDSAVLEAAVTGSLMLGPVTASADKVGVRLQLNHDTSGNGNLGDLDLQFGFKPPNGIGLAVDAAVASGGGYIFLDPDKGEYAGVFTVAVDLPIVSVQVNVAGVLDTKLPGGQPGFSLLFLLVATFDPGFELGFGFTLDGVGGLVGINRSMALEPLRTAFKSHHLENIFFPPDPETAIANAPQTISDLSSIFPITEGHYVFGPMLVLGWGSPDLIVSAEFGGVLELPTFRLALFGLFTVALPTLDEPDPDLIEVLLHIDILGLIDFDEKQLSIDGELYDSHVSDFTLSGQMALRLTWGATPDFALSIGGLNPQFQPPAGFPSLEPLMISLDSGDVSLSLSSYFAVTSNTVQVGADFELHASAAGFTVHGYMGFDALFIMSPFSFTADMRAGVDVLQGSSVLLSIDLDLTLTGPKPWHAHGEGHFHLLFIDVSIPVDVTVGDSGQAPPLPRTDVWPLLQDALKDPRNWSATLPSERDRAVSFAQAPAGDQTLLVHPMGRLNVHEKVVPLDFPLSLFGSAAPNDYDLFKVQPPRLNGVLPDYDVEKDYFAPGQFEALSDADKLSKPSYQQLDAIVSIGSTAVKAGYDSLLNMHYETYYVENPNVPATTVKRVYRPALATQHALAGQSAAGLSPVRHTGSTKYVVPGSESPISTSDPAYVIASAETLEVNGTPSVPSDGTSLAMAETALEAHLSKHPEDAGRLQVIPACEAVS